MNKQDLKQLIREEISNVLSEALNKSLMDLGRDIKTFLESKDLKVTLAKGDARPHYEKVEKDPSQTALVLGNQDSDLSVIVNDSKMDVLEDIVKKYNLKTLTNMKKSGGWDEDPNKKSQSEGEIYMDHELKQSRKGKTFALLLRKFDPSTITK